MTTAPTPTQLMAGFKSGFGEIIDLVTAANDKTGPWVTDRIQKMPQKTQDEIYGRFNEAFNDGTKDAAAGREFYESSLDFPALAQKTTQVADDIELADQINKQFEENAPIKTIYGQYKQLSTSARKEIEKHLKTTAEKAPPKELQNALVTIFDGMGRLENEASKKQKLPGSEKKLIYLAYTFRYDYEVLKQAKSYLGIMGVEWAYEEIQSLSKLFNSLSPYAQLLIEQRIRAHCPGDFTGLRTNFMSEAIELHLVCKRSSDTVKGVMLSLLKSFEANENSESILKDVDTSKLGKMEKLLLDEYLGYPRLIAHDYLGSKFEPSTHDFEDSVLKDHRKRNEEHPSHEYEVFAIWEYDLNALQSQFNKNPDIQILNQLPEYVTPHKNDIQGFIAKYASLSDANKKYLAGCLEDAYVATLDTASPRQLRLCCKKYGSEIMKKLYLAKGLFTKWDFVSSVMFPSRSKTTTSSSTSATSSSAKSAPKAETTKVEQVKLTDEAVKRIVDLAVAYKIDLAVLKQAAKQANADFKTVFESLSPYAQLLIELRGKTGSPGGYSGPTAYSSIISKCKDDPYSIREVFIGLLHLFESNETEEYIYTTQAIRLGATELKLLFQYLRYPRYLAHDSIRTNPNCTFEDFKKEISSKAREITPASSAMASDFQDLDHLVVEAVTQAEKDMSAFDDFQTHAKFVKDLNSKTFNRDEFVAFCSSGNYSHVLRRFLKECLKNEWELTPETATVDRIKEACELALPMLKKNWLLSKHQKTAFGNYKFLDDVYATLPFPKPESAIATSKAKPHEEAAQEKLS
jgi:hypothetical protein